MKRLRSNRRQGILGEALMAALVASSTLLAVPASWDGGGGADRNWQNPLNWSNDLVPTSTTDVTLGASVPAGLTIRLFVQQHANTLAIATINSFRLDGSFVFDEFVGYDPLTLATGDVTRSDLVGTEGTHTLDVELVMADHGFWNIAGQGMLSVAIVSQSSAVPRNLTKAGNGLLYLRASEYTGTTTLSEGVLRLGGSSFTSAVTVAAGTELQLSSAAIDATVTLQSTLVDQTVLRNVAGGSSIGELILGASNPIHVDAGSIFIADGIHDGTFPRSFGKNGPGGLFIGGASTFGGTVLLNQGTISVGHDTALGTTNTVNVNPGTTLQIGANIANRINLGGTLSSISGGSSSGPITLTGNVTLDVLGSFSLLTLGGTITDNGAGFSITKTGQGKVLFSGVTTSAGALNIAQGTISATTLAALPGGPISIQSGGAYELAPGMAMDRPAQIAGPGGTGFLQSGAIYSPSGQNQWLGSIQLQANASVGVDADNLTISGPVAGAFELSKVGGGSLRLTNPANSFSSLKINAGLLHVAGEAGLPAAAPIMLAQGGAISLSGNTTINRSLAIFSDGPGGGVSPLHNESGINTWAGSIELGPDNSISVSAGRLNISGNISGTHDLNIRGPGEISLSGTNSYRNTLVNSGSLTVLSTGALPAGQSVHVRPGGALQLRNNLTTGSNATVQLNGTGVAGQGALFNADGNNLFNADVILETAASIGAAAGTTLTLAGTISEIDPFNLEPLPLVKTGAGILALRGVNSLRGGTIVNNGTLSIDADARLGEQSAQLTLNNSGKLLIAANLATARSFNLNTGSIQPASGVTISYNGATVAGGFLRGPGTHAITGDANFSGVTALSDSIIIQSAATTLTNFTNSGNFSSNAPLIWDGGYITGAGRLSVNSTLAASGFENNGQITINNGATVTNTGNTLASTGGSRITISPGGTLNVSGNSLNLNGALLVNNGTIDGTTNVNYGSLAKGSGAFGAINVTDGGRFSPGNSPGSVTTGSTTWNGGGHYLVEIADPLDASGRDFWQVQGQLILNASSENPFMISLASLDGLVFDHTRDYSWSILHATGGITGFDLAEISLDTSNFKNSLGSGQFSLSSTSSDLTIHFSAVPEPAALMALLAAALITNRRSSRPYKDRTTV